MLVLMILIYIRDRYTAEDMDLEMSTKLMSLANEACSYIHDDRWVKPCPCFG